MYHTCAGISAHHFVCGNYFKALLDYSSYYTLFIVLHHSYLHTRFSLRFCMHMHHALRPCLLIEEVTQGNLRWHLVPIGGVQRRAKHAGLVA